MTIEQRIREAQARQDVAKCLRHIRMCEWLLATTQNPARRAWAQKEREYYAQRAESSKGIAANPL